MSRNSSRSLNGSCARRRSQRASPRQAARCSGQMPGSCSPLALLHGHAGHGGAGGAGFASATGQSSGRVGGPVASAEEMTTPFHPRRPATALTGRRSERDVLEWLVEAVRGGESRTLVVRGEQGVGKTALLDYVAEHASGCRVVRATGRPAAATAALASRDATAGREPERTVASRRAAAAAPSPTANRERVAGCAPTVRERSRRPNPHDPQSGFSPETPAISRYAESGVPAQITER